MNKAAKAFAASKKASEDAVASYRRNTPMVFIRDGERIPFRINDIMEDLVYTHSVKYYDDKGNERFETLFCAMESKGECEGCDRAASGDKRVGNRNPMGAFSVVDLRWFGRVEGDKEFDGEKVIYYNAIPTDLADPFETPPKVVKVPAYKKDDPPRKYTRDDIVRQPKSQLLLLSNKWTNLLGAENAQLSRKCKTCGKGTISIEGYKVGKKGKVVAEDPGDGEPIYSCTKCDDDDSPEPFSILGPIPTFISRVGKDKKTAYAFSADKSQDMEMMEWAEKYKPLDLDEACAPTGAGRYEKLLKSKGGKSEKEEKEVEEDEEDTGDDDDDSLYNKKSKKKKSSSDDDDEPKKKGLKPGLKIKLKSKKD